MSLNITKTSKEWVFDRAYDRIEAACKHIPDDDALWDRFWDKEIARQLRDYDEIESRLRLQQA